MKCPLNSLWSPSLLLWTGLLLHCAEAKVYTEIQPGPLYRVVGSELSISCNTSGFRDETDEKIFEFRLTKPARPNFEINVISTHDKDFGYAILRRRVLSKDISLTHVNPNSVLFQIRRLLKDDEGEYDCQVVTTEGVFDGTYSVKTTVKVIDNSLSVSSSGATTSLSYNEGEALTLTCQASSNTIQHTHLSFTWYLRKDGQTDAQPIISLDRYFTLSPGQGFEQRYSDGAIRLDKLGEATYRLKMAQLEVSDQGKIYCQAQEWIQDPDRSWYMIAQKDAEEYTLTVKATEVTDMSSLVVNMAVDQTNLQEGEELLLSCSIDTQNLKERFFSVAWLWEGIELARIGPTGILTVPPEYSHREKEGELRAVRVENRKYTLTLESVRTSDQGKFVCRAWLEERGSDGSFTKGTTQDSSPQLIKISAAESELSVVMQDATALITESEKLRLVCKVGGFKDQLSVTWQRKPKLQTALLTDVISLSQDGVMETGADFVSRKVSGMRPATDSFILELDEVTPSDSGVYQCTVTERKSNGKIYSQSQSANVTVKSIESLVKLSLKTRYSRVTVGDTVELMCKVTKLHVPAIFGWIKQNEDSSLNTIVTLSSDGPISWSGDQHHYQVQVEKQEKAVMYYLNIVGASHREAGRYQCVMSVFLEDKYKKLPPSNSLMVVVQNPESNLVLTSSPKITQTVNTDIHMNCAVSSKPHYSCFYAVTWLYLQDTVNTSILSSDHNGVVKFEPHVEQKDRHRISMWRKNTANFELTIRQARLSDRGVYECRVVEWLQDPRGDWYALPAKSAITKLDISEPANDLVLDKKKQKVMAKEGDEVKLRCNISSDASALSYKVSWFYASPTSLSMNYSLVELDHTGLLTYPLNQALSGLQSRLRLSRPAQNDFYLGIQRAHKADSGIYWCQVEQYQLDSDGQWKQKASKTSGAITLTVDVTGANLSVETAEGLINISNTKSFKVPCHITQRSSDEAQYQVTWFWQKDAEAKRPIFTAYRNSTLQAGDRKSALRFDRPLQNNFTLTVLESGPDDSGLYFCEVEEWLYSLSLGWRNVATKKSGNLNVTVHTDGNSQAVADHTSALFPVAFAVTVIVLLVIILILVLKMCKNKNSAGNKSGLSLWAEQHPLNDKST